MRLVVVSHKACWSSTGSPSGYATDGGFPYQMRALSELFDRTTLVVPCAEPVSRAGEIPLEGQNLVVAPVSAPIGHGLWRKVGLVIWLLRNSPVIFREIVRADAVHTPIPGDIGTIGMLLAFVLRKPLFVRHCGNWLKPVTGAEHFWKWFMERFAGGQRVMLATGGSQAPPSRKNNAVRWVFSTTLREDELRLSKPRELQSRRSAKLIIVCRQDREKGTGVVIESLPIVLKAIPHATLDVVGDGESLGEFRRVAEELGLSNQVVFHGKVDHSAVVGLLKRADLFCYPTTASEGFPKVVLEALACGVPVLATKVSVLPELISAGGGRLLDEATPTAVAEGVVEILSNSERYRAMSGRAIESARRYSLENWRDTIAEQLRSAWGELTNQKPEAETNRIDVGKLRITFVVGTLGRGGAERQLVYMLRALKSAGVKTRVLCLTKGEPLEQEIQALGIPVTWVGASRWRPIRLYRIIQELRREPAQLLQSSHFYTNLYVAIASRLLGIKSIGAVRNDLTSELKSNGIMGWGQLHLPSHLIANSRLARQRAISKGIQPEHIHLVPNVVDVNGVRKTNGNNNGTVGILFAARLTEQKRPDRFLHALRKVADSRPELDVKGIIAGDGPLRHWLEDLADTLSLRPRHIEFVGELSDLGPAYQKSDMLVLTSDWEGTPNVLLEAMGCALPVVATSVGGIPEIVEHGRTGLLANPEDIDSLTEFILGFCHSPLLRHEYGQRAREYVAANHSAHVLAGSLQQLYTAVLPGASS